MEKAIPVPVKTANKMPAKPSAKMPAKPGEVNGKQTIMEGGVPAYPGTKTGAQC
jgi:hypothetical protein